MSLTDEQKATLDALLQDDLSGDDAPDGVDDPNSEGRYVSESQTEGEAGGRETEASAESTSPAESKSPARQRYKKRGPDTPPDHVTPSVLSNRRAGRIRYHMKKKGWDRDTAVAFVDGKVTPMMAREATLAKKATQEKVKSIPNDLLAAAEAVAKATAELKALKAAKSEAIPEDLTPPKLVRQSGRYQAPEIEVDLTPKPVKPAPIVKPSPDQVWGRRGNPLPSRSTWGSNLRR